MLKIKKFFLKLFNWFSNNAWIQLVVIVGSIFGFIFALPYVVNWFKSKDEKTRADEFYHKYQINDFDNEGKSEKFSQLINNSENKIIMFIPKNNDSVYKNKNVIESWINEHKITFKVIFVENDQKDKFYKFYSNYKDSFFNGLFETHQKFFANYQCKMQEINHVDDFFDYPIIVLLKQNKISKVISDICGDCDAVKKQNLDLMMDYN